MVRTFTKGSVLKEGLTVKVQNIKVGSQQTENGPGWLGLKVVEKVAGKGFAMAKVRFIRRKRKSHDRVEAKFQAVVDLIRDLDRKEFNRLKEGMELVWQGYNKVGQAKSSTEKEFEDIEKAEKLLEVENGRD